MRKEFIISIIVIVTIIFSCKKEPEIPTGNKIEIGETTTDSLSYYAANVSTTITDLGGNQIIQHGHCWGVGQNPTIKGNKSALGKITQPETFTSNLTELNENTIYYVRAYLTSNNSTTYIGEQLIQTLATGKAIVNTNEITDITINTASFGGTNDDGGLTISQRGVCWNTTTNPSLENNLGFTTNGSGTGSFTNQITELTENTTYYVAAYATNEKGTSYGEVKQFSTLILSLPTVSTTEITEITNTSAKSGGDVINDGNGTFVSRGVCWNTITNPTLENNLGFTSDGSGTGSFSCQLTNLTENTIYYVAAYATNEMGTAYGQMKSFMATIDLFDPRDGQTYETVMIGSQKWMAENLKYQTANSWWYDNTSAIGDIYGRLYTWDAATTACPSGWHLPTDNEWKTLEMHLGMSQSEADAIGYRGTDEGKKLKSISNWASDGNGTDAADFTALPSGYRFTDGSFNNLGYYGNWWSATASGSTNAWYRELNYSSDKVYRYGNAKWNGFSVRCLKD